MTLQTIGQSVTHTLASLGIWAGTRGWIGELIATLGALAILSTTLLLWARYFRRQRRRRRHLHHHAPAKAQAPTQAQQQQPPRKHRHHHRREEFKRNPTLAETGGLPPARDGFSKETSLSE